MDKLPALHSDEDLRHGTTALHCFAQQGTELRQGSTLQWHTSECCVAVAVFVPYQAGWQQHASIPLMNEYMLAGVTYLLEFGQCCQRYMKQRDWDVIMGLSEVISQWAFPGAEKNLRAQLDW